LQKALRVGYRPFIAAGVLAFVTAPRAVIAEERIPSLVRRQSIVERAGV